MKPQIYIDKLFIKQDNVNGDNNLWLGADSPAQKIDGRIFVAGLAVIAAALVGSTLYGLMVGAVAFGAMIAPYVVGGALAVSGGIGGVTVWQRRLLKQDAAQPAPLLLCPEALEMAARLIDRGAKLNDYDLAALERVAQKAKQCASLPESQPSQPSAALPLPMQSSL